MSTRIRFRLDDRLLPNEQLPSLHNLIVECQVRVAIIRKTHALLQADGLMLAKSAYASVCDHLPAVKLAAGCVM